MPDDCNKPNIITPTANSNDTWIAEAVTRPTHNDVLFGRGGGVNRHVGNIHFRQLVSKYEYDYRATHRKADKTDISARIVSIIRNLDPPGRFLKNDEGVWRDVGDEKARNKTSQALRERGPSTSNTGGVNSNSGNNIGVGDNQEDNLKARINRKARLLRVKCKLDRESSKWSCIRGVSKNKRRGSNSSSKKVNRGDDEKQNDTVLDTPVEIEDDIACNEKMPSCTNDNVFRTGYSMSSNPSTTLVRKVTDQALYTTDGTASTSSSSASLGSLQDDGVQALLQLANFC